MIQCSVQTRFYTQISNLKWFILRILRTLLICHMNLMPQNRMPRWVELWFSIWKWLKIVFKTSDLGFMNMTIDEIESPNSTQKTVQYSSHNNLYHVKSGVDGHFSIHLTLTGIFDLWVCWMSQLFFQNFHWLKRIHTNTLFDLFFSGATTFSSTSPVRFNAKLKHSSHTLFFQLIVFATDMIHRWKTNQFKVYLVSLPTIFTLRMGTDLLWYSSAHCLKMGSSPSIQNWCLFAMTVAVNSMLTKLFSLWIFFS